MTTATEDRSTIKNGMGGLHEPRLSIILTGWDGDAEVTFHAGGTCLEDAIGDLAFLIAQRPQTLADPATTDETSPAEDVSIAGDEEAA